MSGLQGFFLGLATGVCVVTLAALAALRREKASRPSVLRFPEGR